MRSRRSSRVSRLHPDYRDRAPRSLVAAIVALNFRPRREPQAEMLLEEIFPVAAYYQDTWQEAIQSVRVAGLDTRLAEFVRPLEDEFHCDVRSLLHSAVSDGRIKKMPVRWRNATWKV